MHIHERAQFSSPLESTQHNTHTREKPPGFRPLKAYEMEVLCAYI